VILRFGLIGLTLGMACSAQHGNPFDTTTGADTTAADTGGTTMTMAETGDTSAGSTSAGTGTGTGTGDTDDPGFKLDVGVPDTPPPGQGCDKVDFLFVIDNSGSMIDDQNRLIDNFPAFISAIDDTLAVEDFQLMVVDTDDNHAPQQCELMCAENGPWLNYCGGDWTCGSIPAHLDDACEGMLGAGVIHPLGLNATQQHCDFASGRRYMTSQEPDLAAAFECVARVGTSGDGYEQPMGAMMGAIDPTTTAQGACNEGFVRDDAILVVTVITDEDELPSTGSGTPDDWKNAVLAAKGNDENAVAVLGLVFGPPQYGWPARLGAFVDAFGPRGRKISITTQDWGPAFIETVELIDMVCDGFTPQG
jgi:hypothetical protein